MFGFGDKKKKISAAHAVEAFIDVGTKDAAHNFITWEAEMVEMLGKFDHGGEPLKAAIREAGDDAVLLFAGAMMMGSLMAPKNLFDAKVAQAVYAQAAHQMRASKVSWFSDFVMGALQQGQANPSIAFPSVVLLKELRLANRDPKLEDFMLGPIFMMALADFEMRVPVMTFWKRLSDKWTVTA